jgi:hypothetical protein
MTTRSLLKLPVLSSKALTIIATILSIPFLSFYWMALSAFIPGVMVARSRDWLTPLSIVFYLPFAFFAYTIFGNLYAYALATLASVTAVATGLIKGQSNKLLRVWLLLVMFATIAFPLFFRYQPALVAAPGGRMQWVTNPGFFGGIIKASQNLVERTPCEYELLGWSTDNRLYYRAICSAETQIWQYSPIQSGSPMQASSSPANLGMSAVSENTVLEMVRAEGVRPEAYESVTRPLLLKSGGVVSPDGQWTAVVTQHVYGTQDVIILTNAE